MQVRQSITIVLIILTGIPESARFFPWRIQKHGRVKPYNLTGVLTLTKTTNTHLINVPWRWKFYCTNAYPLQKKEAIGTPNWYEKLGIGYNGVFRNQLSFYDLHKSISTAF